MPHPARPVSSDLSRIAEHLGAEVHYPSGWANPVVTGIGDDSRNTSAGDLYLAIPGNTVHGIDFDDDARERGAVAVLSDRPSTVLPSLVVADPRRTAGPLAAWLHDDPSRDLNVYGITGTNGKTSAAYLTDAALAGGGIATSMITGIDIRGPRSSARAVRTTPDAVPLQQHLARFRAEGAAATVMEVSSHAISQHRVSGTHFAAMGFTNLGRDHLDFHGTMEEYFAAKASMFTSDTTDLAIVNASDRHGRLLLDTVDVPFRTYSVTDARADVVAENIRCDEHGSTFDVRSPHGSSQIRLALLGPHQVSNALMALTMATAAGVDLRDAVAGIERLALVPGRLERVDVGQSFLALVDYVHNPAGQRHVLPYLRSLTSGRVIYVLGATGRRDHSKRFPLGALAGSLADVVVVTDESPHSDDPRTIREDVADGAHAAQRAHVIVEADRRRAIDIAVEQASDGDVVVVGGRGCDVDQIFADHTTHFDDRDQLWESLIHRVFRR